MNFFSRHIGGVSLLAGFLLGCWIGYRILPPLFPPTLPTETEAAAAQRSRETVERDLEGMLMQSENIVAASVLLAPGRPRRGGFLKTGKGTASVTLTFSDAGVRPGQLVTIAQQVASGVEYLDVGSVSIFDAQEEQLNLQAIQAGERKQFWTHIAISIAKVLGIIAALVTLRFVIQAVGKGMKKEEGAA
jgi:hypothetical protein